MIDDNGMQLGASDSDSANDMCVICLSQVMPIEIDATTSTTTTTKSATTVLAKYTDHPDCICRYDVHPECIEQWYDYHPVCPWCKRPAQQQTAVIFLAADASLIAAAAAADAAAAAAEPFIGPLIGGVLVIVIFVSWLLVYMLGYVI
jgi:hypothetical protein